MKYARKIQEEWKVTHIRIEYNVSPLRRKVTVANVSENKIESEEDSTMALELIRFVKKLLAELEPEDSDGDARIVDGMVSKPHNQKCVISSPCLTGIRAG
ncbi:hypothetical protein Tco_0091171 [Tanacetum coccineum]